MEWVERTDRTVDAAKDFLLDQLGVDEDEAEFEVLEEPKPGLFGRVRGQARVRARVTPRAPRAKDERRRRPAKGRDGGAGGSSQRKGGDRAESTAVSETGSDAPATEADTAPTEASAPVRSSSNGDRSGRGQGEGSRSRSQGGRAQDTDPTGPPVDPAPFLQPLTAFLDDLARAFGVTATTEVSVTEDGELNAQIVGDGLGSLIGPSGGA